MAAKKIITTDVSRNRASDYLRKAEQFYGVMQICSVDKEWDAATLNGVHAAISVTDALLVHHAGIHSTSSKHEDAVLLLRQHFPQEKMANNDSRLARILSFKSLVSYRPEQMQETKALSFVKDVERYFEWAKQTLRKAGL